MTYDTIIIGAGAAGLTAGLYAARRNLKTLIISKDVGGQTAIATEIENYPGVIDEPNGFQLMQKFQKQAEGFGAEIKYQAVVSIEKSKKDFKIKTDKNSYTAKTIILAFGLTPRELNVPGEEKLKGKGVAYCATCDGPLFKEKTIAIVGGGNSALDAADLMSSIAKKVYLIHRRNEFTAESVLQKKVLAKSESASGGKQAKNITTILNSEIKKINGQARVESVVVANTQEKNTKIINLDAVFIEIGYQAKTDWLKDLIKLNPQGEIITDENCRTNVPGIFAAGDVTDAPYKQIVISAGEGAKAALQAYAYIQKNQGLDETPDWGK